MKKSDRSIAVAALVLTLTCSGVARASTAWAPAEGPLATRWDKDVSPTNALPEYPRPQLVRSDWQKLNGVWQFQAGSNSDAVPTGKDLSQSILVPYPMESALSGVMQHYDRSWYRRTFSIPAAWAGQRLLLHFGAVDWEAQVYVNGVSVGMHDGGYDAFTYDITKYLKPSGPQELIVRVFDDLSVHLHAFGKQDPSPHGFWYTSSSGIWQTVWLEPVPKTNIDSLVLTPDVDHSSLEVTVNTDGAPSTGDIAVARALDHGVVVGSASGQPGSILALPIANPRLWSPSSPYLYDLIVAIKHNGTVIDRVVSYFGMRKISIVQVGQFKKIYLNNRPIVQCGVLDQGFWPDGLYTAPTDEAGTPATSGFVDTFR